MDMNMIEKIFATHSGHEVVRPGEIVDIVIDSRVARDFGGANVVKNLRDYSLAVDDPARTFFTFDCNPTGSDQKYAVNQHVCRLFARENGIKVYDIDSGIGTHILIDEGLVFPGATAVSTDSHANILGAIGAFGQGMGDMDIAAAWNKGKVWFRVPSSVRIILEGKVPPGVSSKDIVLNLLSIFGANSLLGYSVEIYGEAADLLDLDDRITISSMATEMGAIIILFPPSAAVIDYCRQRTGKGFDIIFADPDARYDKTIMIDITHFKPMVSRPGEPHNTVAIEEVAGQKIDSGFIGSCTNGRMKDMLKAADILRNRRVAPGVVLKVVPSTDGVWNECLRKGLIEVFKNAGALVSNAGCAGCAAGQVGQNGPGEVTISTGNRNFAGKQGKGAVWLASPETVAASAIAGYITSSDRIPDTPLLFSTPVPSPERSQRLSDTESKETKEVILEGRVWVIQRDNIDTDMIFHNRYLSITDISEMGRYTFDNLKGYEDFAGKAGRGDIVLVGKNFGCGSSRQQAVDCFVSLGIQAVIAESFGAIYERNAINAAFPVVTLQEPEKAGISDGDRIRINLQTGILEDLTSGRTIQAVPFSEVQMDLYLNGGLLVHS